MGQGNLQEMPVKITKTVVDTSSDAADKSELFLFIFVLCFQNNGMKEWTNAFVLNDFLLWEKVQQLIKTIF